MRSFLPALLVVTLVLTSSYCMAGDSKTIMISCTIPEIPGVNAPFAIEQNLPVVDLQTTTQEQQANQQELTQAYESKEELIQQQQSFESITLYTFVAK